MNDLPLQLLTLLVQFALISGLAIAFFHYRRSFGVMALAMFLGSLQFLQALLAAHHFVHIGGLQFSPGSAVLFPATLFSVLLVYHAAGAAAARTFIGAIVACNLTVSAIAGLSMLQMRSSPEALRGALDPQVLVTSPDALLAGTLLLALDLVFVIVVSELLAPISRRLGPLRFVLPILVVLAFDAMVFSSLVLIDQPDFWRLLRHQIAAKWLFGLGYGAVLGSYRALVPEPFERAARSAGPGSGPLSIFRLRPQLEALQRANEEQQQRHEREQQLSRQALDAAQARYSALFHASPIGVALVDERSMKIVDVNRALMQLSQRPRHDFVGCTLAEAALFEDASVLRDTPAGGSRVTRLSSRTPTSIDVEVEVTEFGGSHNPLIAISVQDITDRLIAERVLQGELAASERALAARTKSYLDLFENTTDLVLAATPRGELELTNPSWRRVLGYSADRVNTLHIEEALAPESRRAYQAAVEQLLASGEPQMVEVRFLSAGGESLVDTEGSLSLAKGKTASSVLGIFRDVSGRRKLERLKEEFLAIVSHELRTPLTSMFGVLQLLRKSSEPKLSERERRYVDVAHRSAQRLIYLVNDILDFQRHQAGALTPRLEHHRIADAASRAIDSCLGMAEQADVEVVVAEDCDPRATGFVDPGWLDQALGNLLSNGIKFSPSGSRVVISWAASHESVAIRVLDSGPGIPDDAKENIFRPYTQSRAKAGHGFSGSGLGLSITQRLVERMGGRIELASSPQGGTCFTMHFDHRAPQPQPQAPRPL